MEALFHTRRVYRPAGWDAGKGDLAPSPLPVRPAALNLKER
jgi:hypothetical protein